MRLKMTMPYHLTSTRLAIVKKTDKKRWEYQTNLPAFWETCRQVKKQQLESDMEQRTGSILRKEYVKAVYCHPAYLTYKEYIMRNGGLDEAQAGIKIVKRNINNLRYADTPPYGRKWRGRKESLDESERGV